MLVPPSDSSPVSSHPTVADLGERALIERIRTRVPPPPSWVLAGIGDDAAVIEPERRSVEAVTTDGLIEGIHFERALTPARSIGHKALAINLSDLAAMGAAPRAAVLALALPSDWPLSDLDAMLDGLLALAARFRVTLLGGNISRSPGPLVVNLTALGSVRRRRLLSRGGARPGDYLYLSGSVGSAAAGLQWLRWRARPGVQGPAAELEPPRPSGAPPSLGADAGALDDAARKYLEPEPRVRLGTLLGRNRAATACIDLSDGLADAVRQMAEASRVGALVEGDAVPVEPAVRTWFERQGLDSLDSALRGGEEYELLFAVSPRPRLRGRLRAVQRLVGALDLTRIGVITAARDVVIRRDGREEQLPAGFAHFR